SDRRRWTIGCVPPPSASWTGFSVTTGMPFAIFGSPPRAGWFRRRASILAGPALSDAAYALHDEGEAQCDHDGGARRREPGHRTAPAPPAPQGAAPVDQ